MAFLMDDRPIGAALNRDLWAQGEQVEGELDRLIARRDLKRRQTEGERAEEAVWKEVERREAAKRTEENYHGLLANEKHLCGVYYGRFLEKMALIKELEGKPPQI
jgi:regulator of replication initiation timing